MHQLPLGDRGLAVELYRLSLDATQQFTARDLRITAEDLDLDDAEGSEAEALNLKSAREQADRKMIRHALARSEGNISNTAKLLGISRPTLYDLLKQYDLQT